jgi:RNA polymerase sigma-70 factor (ECF subfamily)
VHRVPEIARARGPRAPGATDLGSSRPAPSPGTFSALPGQTVTGDDAGLVARLQASDPRAFEELVIAYQHRVFAVAARMLGNRAEAEEIAQEVFLRVHRAIRLFRGDAKLSTWMYSIASRLCLNRLARAERRLTREEDETLARVPDGVGGADEALAQRQLQAALFQAIAALPEDRRIVVVLRDLEGLSYDEIAQVLDLEPGTVRSRLHRARLELRERLEKFIP